MTGARPGIQGACPPPASPSRVLACFAAATAPAAASDGPLVDLALTAGASAPAVNDGNAATTACASGPGDRRPRPAAAPGGLRGQPRRRCVVGARDDRGRRPAHRGDRPGRHAGVAAGSPPARRPHRATADRRGRLRGGAARARAHLALDDRRPRPVVRRPGGGGSAPPTPTADGRRCPSGSSPTTAPTGCACACGSIRPPATATCRAARDGASREGGRHAPAARSALLGLLGRPAEAADPGVVANGPADAGRARCTTTRATRSTR